MTQRRQPRISAKSACAAVHVLESRHVPELVSNSNEMHPASASQRAAHVAIVSLLRATESSRPLPRSASPLQPRSMKWWKFEAGGDGGSTWKNLILPFVSKAELFVVQELDSLHLLCAV